jgi:hypothetical protein
MRTALNVKGNASFLNGRMTIQTQDEGETKITSITTNDSYMRLNANPEVQLWPNGMAQNNFRAGQEITSGGDIKTNGKLKTKTKIEFSNLGIAEVGATDFQFYRLGDNCNFFEMGGGGTSYSLSHQAFGLGKGCRIPKN